jgi:putative peptidoglycan lipid II flippase
VTRTRALTGLAGAAALVAGITVASRVAGFARWFVQSFSVGATSTGSVYNTANLVPNVLFEIVAGGALASVVVPLLAGPLARGLRADIDRIASALLTWALAALIPTAVLVAVFARPIVSRLMGSPVDQDLARAQVDLGAHLLVVFAPQLVLYGIGIVLSGVLQAQQRFAWPAIMPLVSSLVVMGAYLMFRQLADSAQADPAALSSSAVAWLGWGTTAGVAAMSLPLLVPVHRSGVRLRPTWHFPAGVARRAARLAMAGVGALLAQQVAVVAVVRLSNGTGGPGTISTFMYAQAVYVLPYAVLAVPLATVAFPRLAEHAATGDGESYRRLVSLSTRSVIAVCAVGTAVLLAAAPSVAAAFTAIDVGDIRGMAAALGWLAPGLIGYGLLLQSSRVLYALERGRSAVAAAAVGWLAVTLASILAVRALSGPAPDPPGTLLGLAIGNTLGMTLGGAAMLIAVRRATGSGGSAGLARNLVAAVAAGGLGAIAGRWIADAGLVAWGRSLRGALPAACLSGLVALFVAAAVFAVLDRKTVAEVRRRA